MKLTKPRVITWTIAVAAGVLGILGEFISLPFVSTYAFWFVAFGFALLAFGTFFEKL